MALVLTNPCNKYIAHFSIIHHSHTAESREMFFVNAIIKQLFYIYIHVEWQWVVSGETSQQTKGVLCTYDFIIIYYIIICVVASSVVLLCCWQFSFFFVRNNNNNKCIEKATLLIIFDHLHFDCSFFDWTAVRRIHRMRSDAYFGTFHFY